MTIFNDLVKYYKTTSDCNVKRWECGEQHWGFPTNFVRATENYGKSEENSAILFPYQRSLQLSASRLGECQETTQCIG